MSWEPQYALHGSPWLVAERVLRGHLQSHGCELVSLTRVGAHGAQASICIRRGRYAIVKATVPRTLNDRVAIDGALAFLLMWKADRELSTGPGLEHPKEEVTADKRATPSTMALEEAHALPGRARGGRCVVTRFPTALHPETDHEGEGAPGSLGGLYMCVHCRCTFMPATVEAQSAETGDP